MPLQIVRQDITNMRVDAIVNATNENLLPNGGGIDQQIHNAAGPNLWADCVRLGGCQFGQAKITSGHNLIAKYVIHTAGPIWQGGTNNEKETLINCYKNSLHLVRQYGCASVAFPLISSGTNGFPKDEVLKIAIETISDFLFDNDMMVYLVVFDRKAFSLSEKLFKGIQEYIDDNYVEKKRRIYPQNRLSAQNVSSAKPHKSHCELMMDEWLEMPSFDRIEDHATKATSLGDVLDKMDESFAQSLLRKIDEKGITDAQCYKKANVSKQLFNKIKNNPYYKTSKATAVAFAIALEMDLQETEDLLKKAGFALSNSSKFDVIIKYFIENKNYDIYEINQTLFYYDQILLGAVTA